MPLGRCPVREELLAHLARQVPARAKGCLRVGVDGIDRSGKTTFADELGEQLARSGRPVVRVSADDFHQPRAIRYRRGRSSPEGFWLDSYDYDSLRQRVLRAFGPGGSRCYQPASHDLDSDMPVDPPMLLAPRHAVLVMDGLFLHRDELAGVWNFSVFLHAPFAVSVSRMATRDETPDDPLHPSLERYIQGQQIYFGCCRPWERAHVVVDNSDLAAPQVLPPGWRPE